MKISSTTMSDWIVNIIHSDTFVQFEQTSNNEIFFSSCFVDIHTYPSERNVENFLLHFIDMIITSDKNIDDDHRHWQCSRQFFFQPIIIKDASQVNWQFTFPSLHYSTSAVESMPLFHLLRHSIGCSDRDVIDYCSHLDWKSLRQRRLHLSRKD